MFAVIFEVRPKEGQWDAYLDHAGMLRPELERIDGFLDNVRYRSLTRPGWLLSFSTWRDEKALIRWRTHSRHHKTQEAARRGIFEDYHLRVGETVGDEAAPALRLDATEVGIGKMVSLKAGRWPERGGGACSGEDVARHLGLDRRADGLTMWDAFEAILTQGDLLLLSAWQDVAARDEATGSGTLRVRVIRDYGMFDRREAPQYFPEPSRVR